MSSASDRSWFSICALWLVSCGGASPPPAAPEPTPSAAAPAEASGPSVELEMAQSEPEPEPSSSGDKPPAAPAGSTAPPAASETSAAAETTATRRPIEVLTGPNVAFIVDYSNSQPYEVAERTCDAEAGDDGAARAECMKKARAAFRADVLYFKKDAQGRFWLTVYERKGSALPELYKARVEFADETANSVSVRLKEEKGTRPILVGAGKITVSVPNDYALELNDPKFGKLVYGAKVGLVGDR
jgi:hypothetical protein